MERLGIYYRAGVTKGEASALIDKAMSEPATNRQYFFIKRHGLHVNPAILTKKEATALIAEHKSRIGAIA